jgi:hypothetical protein
VIGAAIIQSILKDDTRVKVTVQTAIRYGSSSNLAADAIHLVDCIKKNMSQYAVNVLVVNHANGAVKMPPSMVLIQSMDEYARFAIKATSRKRKHAKNVERIR